MKIPSQIHDALCTQPITLTVFKPIALELLRLVAEPEINFFTVIKTVKEDQTLSAHVLKMANSPSYIGINRCETIENAAIRLGSQQIANIAIAASLASVHESEHTVVYEVMKDLWLHSHACALGCRSIAMKTGHQGLADHAYMAGLLHDIGKLYLLKTLEHISHDRTLGIILDRQLIQDVFTDLHVDMGCRIMMYFNLLNIYGDVVALHHSEYRDTDDILLSIVRMINVNSRKFQLSFFPTGYLNESVYPDIDTFKLDDSAMMKLRDDMTNTSEM